LPKHSIFHKQDWFVATSYKPDYINDDTSFLSRSIERFFNERPYLDHYCYIFLTKKPHNRKLSSSVLSNLLRKSIVPVETINTQLLQDFLDSAGQFERILNDSTYVKLNRLSNSELAEIIQQYSALQQPEKEEAMLKDIAFKNGIQIGENYCQLYTLADAADLPSLCGSRINYDKYSTDKTKFSIGFASPLGLLLPCNHIYNQYIFIDDAQKTIQKLEGKRLRLQSLSAYSRENTIGRDATNEFLNEAVSAQRLPVKAHFKRIGLA